MPDLIKYDFINPIKFPNNCTPTLRNIIKRIKRQSYIRKTFISLMKSPLRSDILYTRYPYPLFYLLWPFSISQKNCKIITEHNTIEQKEFRLTGSYLFYFSDLIMGGFWLNKVSGIVGVTDEITSYELHRSGDINKPHITIGNGINADEIKVRKPPKLASDEVRLLCVASFSSWHGIDRLLNGLAVYRGNVKICLYIAGDGKEILNLKMIAKNLGIEEKIIFLGFLSGKSLDEMFDLCHIAVGSLGIHRKGLTQTSELKIREYAARGMPFFCSANDADFPEDYPYFLKVPSDNSPINLAEIIHFAEFIYLNPDHHLNMRAYAEKNLDWSIKMKRLKEFCEKLVDR